MSMPLQQKRFGNLPPQIIPEPFSFDTLFLYSCTMSQLSHSAFHRFLQRTDLIRNTQNQAFPISWRYGIQRKHMPFDHVPLNLPQNKILLCIHQRLTRMSKAMEPVTFIRHMPVIQKIIMKQCPSDQSTTIYSDTEIMGNHQAKTGHFEGMLKKH